MAEKILYTVAIGSLTGCQKPYTPATSTTNLNLLVVDGLINTADSTIINLSRSVIVSNKTTVNPETKATVSIENATSTVYTLSETVKGTYVTPVLNLDNTRQYRLRIKTSNGKTYLSDLVDAKVTPAIDSVGYYTTSTGLIIYANTHDATNNTRYYKYNYQETWIFHSEYLSIYYSNGKALLARQPGQYVQFCYGVDYSTDVLINSTVALSQDIAYQFPLLTLPATSEKLETKYTVQVTQQALTKDAYDFWQNLKTNNEQLGGIFGALPSQVPGNIHNIADASEAVIGYISAGTKQKKRIFILQTQLPSNFKFIYPYTCAIDSTMPAFLIPLPSPYTPLFPGSTEFIYTTPQCGDCTTRGSLNQPSYWK